MKLIEQERVDAWESDTIVVKSFRDSLLKRIPTIPEDHDLRYHFRLLMSQSGFGRYVHFTDSFVDPYINQIPNDILTEMAEEGINIIPWTALRALEDHGHSGPCWLLGYVHQREALWARLPAFPDQISLAPRSRTRIFFCPYCPRFTTNGDAAGNHLRADHYHLRGGSPCGRLFTSIRDKFFKHISGCTDCQDRLLQLPDVNQASGGAGGSSGDKDNSSLTIGQVVVKAEFHREDES